MTAIASHVLERRTPRIRIPEFNPYRTVQIHIPSHERHLPDVRRLIERVSIPTWLTAEDVADLKLAATEACLNAIRHGSPEGRDGTVAVVVRPRLEEVVVEVCDEGPGFDPKWVRRSPFPAGENGRGVKLIDSLVDRAEYRRTGTGQRVRLTKRSRTARE
ncbi:MAG: ATP-binding protein [Armatimonadetes bacterium]|nr:ATP-binding protein [Armatimonadota bacterium]